MTGSLLRSGPPSFPGDTTHLPWTPTPLPWTTTPWPWTTTPLPLPQETACGGQWSRQHVIGRQLERRWPMAVELEAAAGLQPEEQTLPICSRICCGCPGETSLYRAPSEL